MLRRCLSRGMNAGACRIQGELPNRNTHAIGTKITEPESALTVGDHNHLYILAGQFCKIFLTRSASLIETKTPLGRRKMCPYSWHAKPTVGV